MLGTQRWLKRREMGRGGRPLKHSGRFVSRCDQSLVCALIVVVQAMIRDSALLCLNEIE